MQEWITAEAAGVRVPGMPNVFVEALRSCKRSRKQRRRAAAAAEAAAARAEAKAAAEAGTSAIVPVEAAGGRSGSVVDDDAAEGCLKFAEEAVAQAARATAVLDMAVQLERAGMRPVACTAARERIALQKAVMAAEQADAAAEVDCFA